MKYVLLTNSEDGVLVVACEGQEAAEKVGDAAVWGEGGVSAWLIPPSAVTDVENVLDVLNRGGGVDDVSRAVSEPSNLTVEVRS